MKGHGGGKWNDDDSTHLLSVMPDLKDVPKEVKNKVQIVAVETVEDVLKEALGIALPKIEFHTLGTQKELVRA